MQTAAIFAESGVRFRQFSAVSFVGPFSSIYADDCLKPQSGLVFLGET